jgi:calcineurin-like phosphoesterase family protein
MHWFTSDWHLGHKNIIIYCKRPFNSPEEMDRAIISNFFRRVSRGDTVYHLGDISLNANCLKTFTGELSKSKINFHLIPGNHDPNKSVLIDWCKSNRGSSISKLKTIKMNKQKVVLCHFPMLSWDCSHYDSWHLYGHHHRAISIPHVGKQMNVSVDIHNFNPVPWHDVVHYMESQPINWNSLSLQNK